MTDCQDNGGNQRQRSQTYDVEPGAVGQSGSNTSEERVEIPSLYRKSLHPHVAPALEEVQAEIPDPLINKDQYINGYSLDAPEDNEPCEGFKDFDLEPRPRRPDKTPGCRNHYNRSHLLSLLECGDKLHRYMEYQRGPFHLHEKPANNRKDDCQWYTSLGHKHELGTAENEFSCPEPLGLRFLPPPDHIPNGLLAALDVVPFAYDEDHCKHHFMAYGVTLVTNNCYGKLVYFNGDASI